MTWTPFRFIPKPVNKNTRCCINITTKYTKRPNELIKTIKKLIYFNIPLSFSGFRKVVLFPC